MDDRIQTLNERFAIEGVAQVVIGNRGLPKVHVTTAAGEAEVYLHGAQVTSWKPKGWDDVFFLSSQSSFEDGKAIRGGVPVCFPWFRNKANDSKAPSHGFVRTRSWELEGISESAEGVTVTLATVSDDASRRWWPHELRIVHRVTVGAELRMELTVSNTGGTAFRFEEALHSYHLVSDARSVRVSGLDGARYQDNVDGNREKLQAGDLVFTGPTDNAYLGTGTELKLMDPGLRRQIVITKKNSLSTVVWNPWGEGARALGDLGDDEWTQMACVEASNMRTAAVELAPGQEHVMTARIAVESL